MSKKRKTRKEKEYKFHDFKSEVYKVNENENKEKPANKPVIEPTIYRDLRKSLTLILISVILLIIFWLLLSQTNLFDTILEKLNISY